MPEPDDNSALRVSFGFKSNPMDKLFVSHGGLSSLCFDRSAFFEVGQQMLHNVRLACLRRTLHCLGGIQRGQLPKCAHAERHLAGSVE